MMPAHRATCEPCRLRRVKCDLRDKGDQCSNCSKRNLICPGVPVTKPRKVRSGKVVDRIEQEYRLSPRDDLDIKSSSSSPSSPQSYTGYESTVTPSDDLVMRSSVEEHMVTMEIKSEMAANMIQCFMLSHGALCDDMVPNLPLMRFIASGKRFDNLNPTDEIITRCFMAIGARTTYHPAILRGGDLSSPLTLGLIREGPCRQLSEFAMSRFDSLGLWRKASPETISSSLTVYMICRSTMGAVAARPFATAAVDLTKQYLESSDLSPEVVRSFCATIGLSVLFVDSLSAAETGNKSSFTDDDLQDIPDLLHWLNVPLSSEPPTSSSQEMLGLRACMLRLLRMMSKDFHRALKKNLFISLDFIRHLWDEQAVLSTRSLEYILTATDALKGTKINDSSFLPEGPLRDIARAMQMFPCISYIAFQNHDSLREAVLRPGGEIWLPSWVGAANHARAELKRMASFIKIVHDLLVPPQSWIQMTRLFAMLDHIPLWTTLLTPDPSDPSYLTREESQIIIDGLQEAGWGAGFACQRWMEAIQARDFLWQPSAVPQTPSTAFGLVS